MKNENKFQGEITHISKTESGTSQAGKEWKKLEFVVKEKEGDYPQSSCFTMFGEEKVEKFLKYNKLGDIVSVAYNMDAREYNGRYFTNLNAWGVRKVEDEQKEVVTESKEESGDLPF